MGHPPGGFWFQLVFQIRSDVQVTRAWSTTKPFHRTAGSEVCIEFFYAEWNCAGRLIRIKHDHRANFMCSVDDWLRVLQERALEQNVREGNEQRSFINRRQHSFQRHRDA